jgi:hypothetical protein
VATEKGVNLKRRLLSTQKHFHNSYTQHFIHHDSRSARIASAGVWWRGYPQYWMLLHADTDVQNRPPATLLRRRSRTSSHEPNIINSRK